MIHWREKFRLSSLMKTSSTLMMTSPKSTLWPLQQVTTEQGGHSFSIKDLESFHLLYIFVNIIILAWISIYNTAVCQCVLTYISIYKYAASGTQCFPPHLVTLDCWMCCVLHWDKKNNACMMPMPPKCCGIHKKKLYSDPRAEPRAWFTLIAKTWVLKISFIPYAFII